MKSSVPTQNAGTTGRIKNFPSFFYFYKFQSTEKTNTTSFSNQWMIGQGLPTLL